MLTARKANTISKLIMTVRIERTIEYLVHLRDYVNNKKN